MVANKTLNYRQVANVEYSEQIVNWLKEIGNLAMQEIPPFIQEVATYGFYSNLVDAFAFLLVFIISLYCTIYLKKQLEIGKKSEDTCMAGMMFSILGVIVFFLLMFCAVEQSIKAAVSPKLYVIERFMKK